MKSFIVRNWFYLLLPLLIIGTIVGIVLVMADGDADAGFQYPL